MSDRNTEPELCEFFHRLSTPEPSVRLRNAVAAARADDRSGHRFGRHGDSRLGLSLVALAASVVLSAGLLLAVYGRGGVGIAGPGGSSSADLSGSATEILSASPVESASAEASTISSSRPSAASSPTPTPDPAFTSGPTGKFQAVGSTILDPSYAVRLPDGRVFLTDGERAQFFDPATNLFGLITGLTVPHVRGTATGLPDGTVLMAGGMDPATGDGLDSATIYDPITGKSTLAGNLIQARFDQHAVALSRGRVLLLGGYDGNQTPLRLAEIYDPATKKSTRTGDMVVGRGGATSITMSDGRVLIAGGDNAGGPPVAGAYMTAEVFDPSTGVFTLTGSLTTGRDGAAAALLPDGRVLVAGGDTEFTGAGTADVYDPRTGKFAATGNMAIGRFSHDATALADGRVLITGGYIEPGLVASVDPSIFAVTDNSYLAWAELYDPHTGEFTKIGPMLSRRVGHTATLLEDGRVLLAGGNLDKTSAEAYVP